MNNNKQNGNIPQELIHMERLFSVEHYFSGGRAPVPALREIDLSFMRGESWGVSGKSLFEQKLLLEIMANIKPYGAGRCVLMERGMMRLKRVVLPHTFYIGSTSMAYRNMNLLEFLMFVTAKEKGDKVLQQEKIFEHLIDIGLGSISLTPIYTLPKEYRAAILLLAASYSGSDIIILNLPDYEYDEFIINAMSRISADITASKKTLVIASKVHDLIEKACSHTLYLKDGRVFFSGTTEEFRRTYDKIVLTIWDQSIEDMAERLKILLPDYSFEIKNDSLEVKYYKDGSLDICPKLLYEKIVEAGFAPERVKINLKTVKNACEEIDKQTDDLH